MYIANSIAPNRSFRGARSRLMGTRHLRLLGAGCAVSSAAGGNFIKSSCSCWPSISRTPGFFSDLAYACACGSAGTVAATISFSQLRPFHASSSASTVSG